MTKRMAYISILTSSLVGLLLVGCQGGQAANHGVADGSASMSQIRNSIVEASCGQCQFGLEGSGCDLSIRIDGAAYFVDGTSIDDHGDAHASDGFCNAVRDARVSGDIVDGRFVVSQFKLVTPETD